MCTYIIAILPAAVSTSAILSVCDPQRFAFEPLDPPSAVAPLRVDEIGYRATRGRCDCGTALGEAHGGPGGREREIVRRAQRLARRKGWSPARVARWAEQIDHNEQEREGLARAGETAALAEWCGLVRAVIEQRTSPQIGLLRHDGHDQAPILRRDKTRLAQLSQEQLRGFENDVLYEYVR